MQTVDFIFTSSILWIIVFSSVTAVGLVTFIFLKWKKNTNPTAVFITSIVTTGIIVFTLMTMNIQQVSDTMVQKIEEDYKISELNITNKIPACTEGFTGFLTAGTWKFHENQEVGLIFGKPIENGCQFTLKKLY